LTDSDKKHESRSAGGGGPDTADDGHVVDEGDYTDPAPKND
jgi:hypothetical protein